MSTDLTTLSGATMGTRFAAQFPEPTSFDRKQLQGDLHHAVDAVDQQMSPWIESSVVNRFNAASVGEWIDIPIQTAAVIEKALNIEDKSNGAFSIAVAPQVRHYGFSTQDSDSGVAPQMGKFARDAIELSHLKVRKSHPIEIDLCGIAKGFAVDAMSEVMNAHDIKDFMVSIDGELRCQGMPSMDQPWQVAIEDPVPHLRQAACVLPCGDLALATSGGYRNFDVVEGQPGTHTINPRTGQPLRDMSSSVVVAHESCCEADAWATALLVMPVEQATTVIQKEKLNVLFLTRECGETLCMPHGIFV